MGKVIRTWTSALRRALSSSFVLRRAGWLCLLLLLTTLAKAGKVQADDAQLLIRLVPNWQGERLCLQVDKTSARLLDAQGSVRWSYSAAPAEILAAGGAPCVQGATEGMIARLRISRHPMPFGEPRTSVTVTLLPR